jgi:hypothetical protein
MPEVRSNRHQKGVELMHHADWGRTISLDKLLPGQAAILPDSDTLQLSLVICATVGVDRFGLNAGHPILLCRIVGGQVPNRFVFYEMSEVAGEHGWLLPADWRIQPVFESVEKDVLRKAEHIMDALFLCEDGRLNIPVFHQQKRRSGFASWVDVGALRALHDIDQGKHRWIAFTSWDVVFGPMDKPTKIWSR